MKRLYKGNCENHSKHLSEWQRPFKYILCFYNCYHLLYAHMLYCKEKMSEIKLFF